jgi:hypothetical protein
MSETIIVAEEDDPGTGRRFSWGLAFAGAVAATAVTFFLLTLGSGVGLLLVHPSAHPASALPAFFTGGAIYFFVAQAFGFAVGGHLVGRLMGPIAESHAQEEFRAAAHGFAAWAVAVLAALAIVAFAGATTASVYGVNAAKTAEAQSTAYLTDVLFRPGAPGDEHARAEAGRILDAGLARGEDIAPDDRDRLATIVSHEAAIPRDAALSRIDAMQANVQAKTRHAADVARKAASFASLWIALSLLFGAIVSIVAAVLARNEDDRRSLLTRY